MKTIFTLIIIFININSFAQWQPEIMIANNSGLGYPIISISGNYIHVFWHDNRFGNWEIMHKLSTDGGTTWSPDIRISNDPGTSSSPQVIVNGPIIDLTWVDNRDGNNEIYYKHSSDNGFSWGNDVRLTNDTNISSDLSITKSDQNIHLVWTDNRNGNNEIYYKHSNDNGISWSLDKRLTNDTMSSTRAKISAIGEDVYIVWRDGNYGNSQLFLKTSSNGGNNWDTGTQITNSPVAVGPHKFQASGNNLHVIWQDSRSGHNEIYYQRSTNSGVTWRSDTSLTSNSVSSFNPSIFVSGSRIHIACQRVPSSFAIIYYNNSIDGGDTWSTEVPLTPSTTTAYYPNLAADGTTTVLVFNKNIPSSATIYFKKNPNGNITGINGNISELPGEFKLLQNYPNPFNPETNISFEIPKESFISIAIYDVTGRKISTLVSEKLSLGVYNVNWNASAYPSGIYFYSLETDKFTQTKKMLLVK